MSLSSVFSVDGILRATGVAEEDIETFRLVRNTLADATIGLISRIYQEYRALTPEQRQTIRQNLIQGARQIAHELHDAVSNEDIHGALRRLTAPMPQRTLPGTTPHHSVMIEELDDEAFPLPSYQRQAITHYTPPSRSAAPDSSANDDDAALALALQTSAEENDAQFQAALAASFAEIERSSASSSSSAQTPAVSKKEGQKFRANSKRSAPEKAHTVATPTYIGEGDDDLEFKKAMEDALAESLKSAKKSVTPSFDHKCTNNNPARKDDQDDDTAPSHKRQRTTRK